MASPQKSEQEKYVSDINIHHIDVLDGIRALAILIVVWFHMWQQCWLMPIADTPALSFLNISQIDLDWIPRTGYIMVTLMIFLSGFCLFLPYARHSIYGEVLPKTGIFYKKRVARILPSYLFCIIIMFVCNAVSGAYYGDTAFMMKDLFTHLTFTFNLSKEVTTYTLLNGVLWTVALEVQFYIIFPAIQYFFRKKPILTYIVMNIISFAFILYAQKLENNSFMLHQLPSYLGVYANGFVGAQIFVGLSKKIKRDNYIGLISTITSLGCIYVYYIMMKELCLAEKVNNWQLHNRYYLSVLFMIFVLSTSFSLGFYRKIFSNRIMRFLSTISFNLYIWHQVITIALKEHRIPYYEGDIAPNESGDKIWMWKYFLLCVAASLAMAVFTTYLIEKPCSRLIMKIRSSHSSERESHTTGK